MSFSTYGESALSFPPKTIGLVTVNHFTNYSHRPIVNGGHVAGMVVGGFETAAAGIAD
jgi:hypothetical protein